MPKHRTDKRPFTARELATKFNCSQQTIRNFWSQSRSDYLSENIISKTKPWEKLGISRATWYRQGKPTPSETLNQQDQSV